MIQHFLLMGVLLPLIQRWIFLHNFSRASGLKIYYSKSEAMKIGSLILNEDLQPPGEIQQWTKGPVRLLGVKLSNNDKELFNLNYNPQINKN